LQVQITSPSHAVSQTSAAASQKNVQPPEPLHEKSQVASASHSRLQPPPAQSAVHVEPSLHT
jgi:hypothetical protein